MGSKAKKKLIIIISAIVALVAVVAVALVLLLKKDETYRIIKVYEIQGEAVVTREGTGEMSAYENMVLESGDNVQLKSGAMTLKLDDDKYVYVEPGTEFNIIATGSKANSKTKIDLQSGAIINDVQQALSDDSSYEINTPNSNMAVRGTVFRVYTYVEDGIRYTKVSVFEGKVDSNLVYADGRVSENSVAVEQNKETIIYEDDVTTDYLIDVSDIDYNQLPPEAIKALISISEAGSDLGVTSDELKAMLEAVAVGPFTVTFMYNGAVFGTQTVESGQCATIPSLMPANSGNWDFDFTEEIYSDTVIEWR
ncbi:MAG: hypothetical protein E7258_03615 [Lachnospiraceae bacterium]|nr:hypothetical protein [Lachnospiraceae bacterium]